MNQKISQYLEETNKEFEEKFNQPQELPNGDISHFPNLKGSSLEKEIKSFLHERQIGLVEVVKGLVPEKYYDDEGSDYAIGFNACRSQFLKNLELKEKDTEECDCWNVHENLNLTKDTCGCLCHKNLEENKE